MYDLLTNWSTPLLTNIKHKIQGFVYTWCIIHISLNNWWRTRWRALPWERVWDNHFMWSSICYAQVITWNDLSSCIRITKTHDFHVIFIQSFCQDFFVSTLRFFAVVCTHRLTHPPSSPDVLRTITLSLRFTTFSGHKRILSTPGCYI